MDPDPETGWRCRQCGFWNDNIGGGHKCFVCGAERWTPEEKRAALDAAWARVAKCQRDIILHWYPVLTHYRHDENYVHDLEWRDGHTVGD